MKYVMPILLILFSAATICSAKSITLPTYFPSPDGSYDYLRLLPRNALSDPCIIGTIYVDTNGELKLCQEDSGSGKWGPLSSVWMQSNNYIYPVDSTNEYLTVGIGIKNAAAPVHVGSTGEVLLEETLSDDSGGDGIVGINFNDTSGEEFRIAMDLGRSDDYLYFYSDDAGGGGWSEVMQLKADGKLGIGTSPLELLHIKGALLSQGTIGTSPELDASIAGAGTRLIWYPRKAAFRAGYAGGNEWNDSVIGDYSIAMGYTSRAYNTKSIAIGYITKVFADESLGLGCHSEVFDGAHYSVAAGVPAYVRGVSSVGFGRRSNANGLSSVATGYYTTASGDKSIAMSRSSTASGENSFSLGSTAVASGKNSIAFGRNVTSSATYSVVLGGYGNVASGYKSVALGYYAKSSGTYSLAMGDHAEATGGYSTAINGPLEVNGTESTGIALSDQTGVKIIQDNTLGIIGGNVGINTVTPTEALEVSGDILASGGGTITGVIVDTSSREYKENIEYLSLEEAFEVFESLEPVEFRYIEESSGDKHLGFIAEDVPELVSTPDREGVSTMDITAVLTKIVQSQSEEIEQQKNAIMRQQEQIEELKRKLGNLK